MNGYHSNTNTNTERVLPGIATSLSPIQFTEKGRSGMQRKKRKVVHTECEINYLEVQLILFLLNFGQSHL